MASIKQMESGLKAKDVEIARMKMDGKDVAVAFGTKNGSSYYWNKSGLCFANTGGRTPSLDLKL